MAWQLCLVALVILGAWLWGALSPRKAQDRAREEPAGATGEPTAATIPPGEVAQMPTEQPGPVVDRAKRDQIRALIWQAIAHSSPPDAEAPKRGAAYVLPDKPPWDVPRNSPRPAAPTEEDAAGEPVHGIDPKYIQERVRNDFFPVARKCYGDALERDPQLAGSLVFAFKIVGDEKTGGIVEEVDVLNESTLRDPDVIDCMRQSFLSVTFPAPEGGGEVTVVYPITFSNSDGG